LLGRERAAFAFAAHARAHNEFDAAGRDRINKGCHFLRAIAVVTVEKHDDVRYAKCYNTSLAGGAIAALVFDNDARACCTRSACRAIVRAIIGDNDVIDP
jgi:hypothetical protein